MNCVGKMCVWERRIEETLVCVRERERERWELKRRRQGLYSLGGKEEEEECDGRELKR